MKRIYIYFTIILLLTAQALAGTVYHINGSSGSDNNTGLSPASAWRTIGKANSNLQAGDTVYIMAGTYTGTIQPSNSGSPGNLITYTNYNNDTVIIDKNNSGNGVNLSGRSYVKVEGITIQDVDYWVRMVSGASHNTIENCNLYNANSWGGVTIEQSDHNTVKDCHIENGFGDTVQIYTNSTYNLIQDNTVIAGDINNHGAFTVRSLDANNPTEYNIIRGNRISDGYDDNLTVVQYAHHNLIEDNIIFGAPSGGGIKQCGGEYNIVRRNRMYGNKVGYIIYTNYHSGISSAGNYNRFYNNTVYNNNGGSTDNGGLRYVVYQNGGDIKHNVSKNNIFFYNTQRQNYTGAVPGEENHLGDNSYTHNILYRTSPGQTTVRYKGSEYTTASANSNIAEYSYNIDADPRLENASGNNFYLREDSPCIEVGDWLTTITSSGSGTQFYVADAKYFCDGYGITQGDTIQLEGQIQTARITNVNYSTNTITVNSSLSWYSGQGVSLAYSGYAPDIGAYEYTGFTPPPPLYASANGSPGSGYIPLTVNFTGSATGGTPSYSYSWTFGDGGTSTSQNPSHTYTTVGDFTATLTVTDNANNQDSDTIIIHASATELVASLSASPTSGLAPLTVNFTGDASGGVAPYSYSWNFGDGGTSISQNPSHTYSQPGNFNVVLTVTDSASQQDIDNATINVSSQNPNFTLSISSSTGSPAPGSGGTVDPPPGNHYYSSGTNAQIEATPNSNYRFSSWTGDVSNSVMGNTQFTLTMDADKSISAKFCTRCGDINGDLTITPMDAQNIFDIFLGILSDPTLCQRENADVNCDGTPDNPNVTPFDAQSIFDYYLGMADLPGDCSYNTRASSSGLIETISREFSDVNLLIPDPLFLPGGDEILVPVMIDSSIRLESFGFDLVFDTDLFEFAGVARAELTKDFIQVGGNVIDQGVLRVGGYREKTFEDCSPGELVILIFKVKREIEEPTTFTIVKTYDDIKNASVDAG